MAHVPHLPVHDDERLIFEPVTWLDGSPVTPTSRLSLTGLGGPWGLPGVVALAEGIALLCCFSLPWFSIVWAGPAEGPAGSEPGLSHVSLSGWTSALGMPAVPSGAIRIALFVHLWFVPLAAAALLVIAWRCLQRRLSPQLAAGAVLALSLLALLIGLGFCVQVASLGAVMASAPEAESPIAVAWGCWLTLAVSALAAVASARVLRPSLPSLAGEHDGTDSGLDSRGQDSSYE
jgi:hypothetical protein